MGGVSGDFSELAAFQKAMEALSDGKAVKQIASSSHPKIARLLDAQFASGTDPYGNAWPRKKDGSQALQDARGRVSVAVQGEGISASIDAVLEYHQQGSSRNPQRLVVPTEAMGIPDSWRGALEEAASEIMKQSGFVEGG